MVIDIIGFKILPAIISKSMVKYICDDKDEILSKPCCIKIFLYAAKYIRMET